MGKIFDSSINAIRNMTKAEQAIVDSVKEVEEREKIKPSIEFDKLSAADKWALVKQFLLDSGYIDK